MVVCSVFGMVGGRASKVEWVAECGASPTGEHVYQAQYCIYCGRLRVSSGSHGVSSSDSYRAQGRSPQTPS